MTQGILPICQSNISADLVLTGSGVSRVDCGNFYTVGCLNELMHRGLDLDGIDMTGKGVFMKRRISCRSPLCPVCWGDWANREADRAEQRLASFKIKDRVLKPIHVTVSVPFTDWKLSVQGMRRKTYRALKRVHYLGGMLIYHSKRQKEDKSWFFSPHFHTVGYGWLTDVRANYVYSGYIVKNLRIRKTVRGTIYYQLSHCGISKNLHTVTWFGKLSYSKLHVKYEKKEREVCPLCGNQFREVVWVGKEKCLLPDIEGITVYDDVKNWLTKPKLDWFSEFDVTFDQKRLFDIPIDEGFMFKFVNDREEFYKRKAEYEEDLKERLHIHKNVD